MQFLCRQPRNTEALPVATAVPCNLQMAGGSKNYLPDPIPLSLHILKKFIIF